MFTHLAGDKFVASSGLRLTIDILLGRLLMLIGEYTKRTAGASFSLDMWGWLNILQVSTTQSLNVLGGGTLGVLALRSLGVISFTRNPSLWVNSKLLLRFFSFSLNLIIIKDL